MKIINTVYGSALGGRWQVFVDYGRVLRARGHDVIAVIHPRCADDVAALEATGCRIARIRSSGHYDPLATLRVMALLWRERPDVIVSHSGRSTYLMKHAALGRVPVVAVNHSHNVARTLMADAFINITHHIAGLVRAGGAGAKPGYHVPNMMAVPAQARFQPREYHDPPVIGALGRMVPYKGFHVLLEALGRLRDDGVDFRAVIGGDGEERPRLEAQVRDLDLGDRVRLPGWVRDKAAFFAGVDLLCVPSLDEPFGLVVLEAWRQGLAVVASDAPGPAETCEDGVTARVVPRGDAAALAAALGELLAHPNRARALAAAGFARLRQVYDEPVIGARIERVLEQVAHGPA